MTIQALFKGVTCRQGVKPPPNLRSNSNSFHRVFLPEISPFGERNSHFISLLKPYSFIRYGFLACFMILFMFFLMFFVRFLSKTNSQFTKRAIIDVNSIVSGWNYDILTLIVAKLLTSQPFGDLSQKFRF